MTNIAIIDRASGVSRAEIVKVAEALQTQAVEHFFPVWGALCTVTAPLPGDKLDPAWWTLYLVPSTTVADALGYHDDTATGGPELWVVPPLDEADGVKWSVTASHEVLEALADPLLRRGTQDNAGAWWALEVCDAVEQDSYEIDGVAVSNFVTPQWAEPPSDLSGVKYDYLELCKSPFEIRPGGYAQRWTGNAWQQLGLSSMRRARAALAAAGMSRSARRRK